MEKGKLTFYDLFYTFLMGCFTGWIIEGVWTLLKKNVLINHSALVIGPFNIVYGIGALVLTIFLYGLRDKKSIYIFSVSFIVGSLLEYSLSVIMEELVGFVAWNYSKKFLNINGRICLAYSIFWGILGVVWVKMIYPRIERIIKNTNHDVGNILMKWIIGFLIFDTILTFCAIDRGKRYDQGIPPQNGFEEVLDNYFGVNYLNNMFNNRWNKK